jgi:hypothetical protein
MLGLDPRDGDLVFGCKLRESLVEGEGDPTGGKKDKKGLKLSIDGAELLVKAIQLGIRGLNGGQNADRITRR